MLDPLDHAEELLYKAGHDLLAGDAILAQHDAFDMVCFHAQQAVEKCLKALLAARDVEYPHRHDIGELTAVLLETHPALAPLAPQMNALTPYAVQNRYLRALEPDEEEAREALSLAHQVHDLVRDLIPRPAPEEMGDG